MKLYYTPTSPFVRKVLVCARELGLEGRVETVLLRPSPTQADPTLSRENPLSKIPALVRDDGRALYDSRVICEYLDALAGGGRLLAADGDARWDALRAQALADGVLDASILVFYERLHRPKELHWEPWLQGQTQKALQGLDALDALAPGFSDTPDLGQIAAACAVGWHLFRAPLGDVLADRPALARWYARFAERPSMLATAPHA
ncbi:MAG: glutathione S-transferase N-terminal domain-containing protein [Polyangiales bacterium]